MFYYNVHHPKKKRRASCLCSNDDIIYITDTKSSRHTNSSVKKCYVNEWLLNLRDICVTVGLCAIWFLQIVFLSRFH